MKRWTTPAADYFASSYNDTELDKLTKELWNTKIAEPTQFEDRDSQSWPIGYQQGLYKHLTSRITSERRRILYDPQRTSTP